MIQRHSRGSLSTIVATRPQPTPTAREEKRVKAFDETSARDLKPGTLQDEMNSKGYALIRGLLPREAVSAVLGDTTRVLSAAGWLSPDSDPRERVAAHGAACGDPDPRFKQVYQEVFNLE